MCNNKWWWTIWMQMMQGQMKRARWHQINGISLTSIARTKGRSTHAQEQVEGCGRRGPGESRDSRRTTHDPLTPPIISSTLSSSSSTYANTHVLSHIPSYMYAYFLIICIVLYIRIVFRIMNINCYMRLLSNKQNNYKHNSS